MTRNEYFCKLIADLCRNWHWNVVCRDDVINKLIYTSPLRYRRDNRIVQNVDNVKFKFKLGDYSPDVKPHRFCISAKPLCNKKFVGQSRVIWVTHQGGNEIWIKDKVGVITKVPIGELFLDPYKILPEELTFVDIIYPEIIEGLLPVGKALPKMRNELRKRING